MLARSRQLGSRGSHVSISRCTENAPLGGETIGCDRRDILGDRGNAEAMVHLRGSRRLNGRHGRNTAQVTRPRWRRPGAVMTLTRRTTTRPGTNLDKGRTQSARCPENRSVSLVFRRSQFPLGSVANRDDQVKRKKSVKRDIWAGTQGAPGVEHRAIGVCGPGQDRLARGRTGSGRQGMTQNGCLGRSACWRDRGVWDVGRAEIGQQWSGRREEMRHNALGSKHVLPRGALPRFEGLTVGQSWDGEGTAILATVGQPRKRERRTVMQITQWWLRWLAGRVPKV